VLKVGIYTPYNRSEITLAAVQLADWLVRVGVEVTMLAEGKIASGVHPVWDTKVRRATKRVVYLWARDATHLCWFNPKAYALQAAYLVSRNSKKRKTRHIYFPNWNESGPVHAELLQTADRVICFSPDLYHWLAREHPIQGANRRTWASIASPAFTLLPKKGMVSSTQTKLLVVVTQTVELDIGIQFLQLFSPLLEHYDALHITFLLEHSIPRKYRRELARMKRVYGSRIGIEVRPPYSDYVHLARHHDWVYLTNTRFVYGSLLSLLVGSTVPIVCHDVGPVRGHVANGVTGKLISCSVHEWPAPVAVLAVPDIIDGLLAVLGSGEAVLRRLQMQSQAYFLRKQVAFEKFILTEFVQ
jgi:hypothetical protein